ncbi:MAG: helix-turn-helix domain-containing protein [Microcystis panniformis]
MRYGKAYSFRFYPTPEQESLLRRTLGCVRLFYNRTTLNKF